LLPSDRSLSFWLNAIPFLSAHDFPYRLPCPTAADDLFCAEPCAPNAALCIAFPFRTPSIALSPPPTSAGLSTRVCSRSRTALHFVVLCLGEIVTEAQCWVAALC
jgi:hypothetical protein